MTDISVIVPVRNHVHCLPRLLVALWRQDLPRDCFEIVVVLDGTTDGSDDVIAQLAQGLRHRVLRQAPAGPAAARNLGLFAASGSVVLFLDPESIPHHTLLRRHRATHAERQQPVWLRSASHAPAELPDPSASVLWRSATDVYAAEGIRADRTVEWSTLHASGLSAPRGLLVRHGVFDPALTPGWAELELAWRLRHHGLAFGFAEGGFVKWPDAPRFPDMLLRAEADGVSWSRVVAKHPLLAFTDRPSRSKAFLHQPDSARPATLVDTLSETRRRGFLRAASIDAPVCRTQDLGDASASLCAVPPHVACGARPSSIRL